MPDFREQEERLKFLISRINSEISKFEKIQQSMAKMQEKLNTAITQKGLLKVPIDIFPHSEDKQSLYEELRQHVLDLYKLKNLISTKLDLVIKEEELLADLQKEYGTKVELQKLPTGEFELRYHDTETEEAYNAIRTSKKLVSQLRETIGTMQN